MARNKRIPIKKAFKEVEMSLSSIIVGWRVRRIIRTKEIQNYFSQIRDFKQAIKELKQDRSSDERKKKDIERGLKMSVHNTVKYLTLSSQTPLTHYSPKGFLEGLFFK